MRASSASPKEKDGLVSIKLNESNTRLSNLSSNLNFNRQSGTEYGAA